MRLIDANMLKESIHASCNTGRDCFSAELFCEVIDEFDTVDVQPVRHGRWEKCDLKKLEHGFIESIPGGGICCSECRCGFSKQYMWWTYCPNCGAKMDGVENQ